MCVHGTLVYTEKSILSTLMRTNSRIKHETELSPCVYTSLLEHTVQSVFTCCVKPPYRTNMQWAGNGAQSPDAERKSTTQFLVWQMHMHMVCGLQQRPKTLSQNTLQSCEHTCMHMVATSHNVILMPKTIGLHPQHSTDRCFWCSSFL